MNLAKVPLNIASVVASICRQCDILVVDSHKMIYDISIFYVHVHKPSILLMINEQLVDADFIHDTILLTAAVNR